MAPPMRPNNSRGGSVSRNRRGKGGCIFRCLGCLPTGPVWIRSKSGSVCCSANICSLITLSRQTPSNPLSASISPITIKRPSRSTGPTPSRSLNRKSVRIYDSVYLVPPLPYARIKERVDQLGQEIRDEHGESDHQETSLNQGVIVALNALIQCEADTRIVEDYLCEQGAADYQAQ